MSKKKRLGRGLEALLGVGNKAESSESAEPDKSKEMTSSSESNDSTGIQLSDSGTIVNSIDDIVSPSVDGSMSSSPAEKPATDGPTILKFQQGPKKPAQSPSKSIRPSVDTSPKESSESDSQPALTHDAVTSSASSMGGSELDGSGIVELNVYDVDDNPFQPRREFNKTEIESLAESLKTHEQLQPILVRKVGDRYQLISGERRLRAAVHAGWSKIRAQVREADDRLVAELAIVENLQRKDLNPVEKALSFRRYIDEHGCSQEDLAGRLKIDRSTVANLLRLLELPDVVQKAIQMGIISNGHARALLPLGEEHLQIEFCNRIQREGLSVRAIEQLVRDKIDEEDGVKRKPAAKGRTKSGQILSLESELRNALGTKVEIKASSRGRGKIVIHYVNRDEFDRLRQIFGESGGSANRDAA